MEILTILLIWFVAPFVELGFIIGLYVKNGNYKNKIEELKRQLDLLLQERRRMELPPEPPGGQGEASSSWVGPGHMPLPQCGSQPIHQPDSMAQFESVHFPQHGPEPTPFPSPNESPVYPASAPPDIPKGLSPKKQAGSQNTAALIIGVVFVILAGLIFATTTWHLLSSGLKVVFVAVFSIFMFGASFIAGKGLKIRRTGQAFYILGSIFLFLTILTAGYFELLGSQFILLSENRWRVLWVGSVVTELALLAGIKQFKDKAYTHACLWGMTVSMSFLMGALKLEYHGFVNGMMYYAFLLALFLYLRDKKLKQKGISGNGINSVFAIFATVHFFVFAFLMAVQGVMGCLEGFAEISVLSQFAVTIWSVLAMGTMAAGITLLALIHPGQIMMGLHSAACILFLQYWVFILPVDYTNQIMAAVTVTALWFFVNMSGKNPLGTLAGDCISTAFILINTFVLCILSFFAWEGIGKHLAASWAVILLGAVTGRWSRRFPAVRGLVPVAPTFLILTVGEIMFYSLGANPEPEMLTFLFFFITAVFDVLRKDRFCLFLLIGGSLAQLMNLGGLNYPFFVLLSVYLLLRSRSQDMPENLLEWYRKGSCLYLLAGIYVFESLYLKDILKMMIIAAVYWAEVGFVYYRFREHTGDKFWDITGTAVFLLIMKSYYFNGIGTILELALCMASFGVFYLFLYRRKSLWPHLLVTLSALPVPLVLVYSYGFSENLSCAVIAAVTLVTAGLMRRYRPIIMEDSAVSGGWRIDWFHILVCLPMAWMIWGMDKGWRTAYILLLALYCLQYLAVPALRKLSFTLAAAIAVVAFWSQPFIQWPEILSLEINLIPAAGFIWFLGFVWKRGQGIRILQTFLYCVCLGLMTADVFAMGEVADALILEVICLTLFIWSQIKKCTKWIRISCIIIVAVALYMTKDFWLSLSWWIYLLTAGLGLIVFAAINEMKKR